MPNTKSAKKRLRQNISRREVNRSRRSTLRTLLRKVREAVGAGDKDQAQTELKGAIKALDKAAASSLIHRNKAARTKSRLCKLVKSIA